MSFLAIPWIQTLLLILAIVAVVVELFRPTYGIAAGVAVVAFGLFFWGAISAGMANWMEGCCLSAASGFCLLRQR